MEITLFIVKMVLSHVKIVLCIGVIRNGNIDGNREDKKKREKEQVKLKCRKYRRNKTQTGYCSKEYKMHTREEIENETDVDYDKREVI